jgi:hypothetical protein
MIIGWTSPLACMVSVAVLRVFVSASCLERVIRAGSWVAAFQAGFYHHSHETWRILPSEGLTRPKVCGDNLATLYYLKMRGSKCL